MTTCPVHDGQPAYDACPRCKAPMCGYCEEPESDLCPTCREQREAGGVLPWEQPGVGVVAGFFRTIGDVLRRPGVVFLRLPPGSVLKALLFTALFQLLVLIVSTFATSMAMVATSALGSAVITGLGGSIGVFLLVLLIGIPLTLVLAPLSVAIWGGLHFIAVSVLGGRGNAAQSIRTVAYASAIAWVWALLPLVGNVPVIGPVFAGLALLFHTFFVGAALAHAAEGSMELRGGKAWLAAFLPSLLFLLLLGGWIFFLSGGPTESPDVYGPVRY